MVFRARLETAWRLNSPLVDGIDGDWRRRRVQVEGRYKRLEYEVSQEFGDPVEPERDAFVNMRFSRRFELQGGRFKIPFGRDALASGANLDFVSRSLLGRTLAPGRDVGVMAHGRLSDRLTYDAGYFLHDGDNSRSGVTEGGDHAVAGRIEFQPFTERKNSRFEPLEIGVAVLRSQLDDSLGLRGQTVFGDGDFFERVFAEKDRIDVFLLGTGKRQVFPSPELRGGFAEAGLGIEPMDTGAACRTYNVLLAEHRRVAAALIAVE